MTRPHAPETLTATELETVDRLRALVAAAAPATAAPAGLAAHALRRTRPRPIGRRRLALGAGAVVAAVALAAAGFTDRSEHVDYTMPSASMSPTVAVGQSVVLARDLAPQRGDVVLLETATGDLLTRVIGLPGDTVSCPAEADGTCAAVVVSGRPLAEPWLAVRTSPFEAVTVPTGRFFALGDARDAASDSRVRGSLPLSDVNGVAVARRTADGALAALPGAPAHPLPGGGEPVDPAAPVPPAGTG